HALGRLRATDRGARAVEDVAAIVHRDHRPGGDQGADVLLGFFRSRPVTLADRRVDHRVALFALPRGLALVDRRLHHPRLDPELAEAEALVGLEFDRGPREQVVAAAAGVLEQVAGELLLQRA